MLDKTFSEEIVNRTTSETLSFWKMEVYHLWKEANSE